MRILLFSISMLCTLVSGAVDRHLSLGDAIAMARANSVDAAVALNELRTAYWEYRTYRADLLPELNFSASLPSYQKSYTPYQLEDGSYTFVRNNYLGLNGTLSLQQNIWLTGGTFSVSTSLDYMRQLSDGSYNRFMSVPIALTLNQPLFSVNHIKWSRKIEPVKYREAQADFLSATENVAMTTIQYFFNLLMAQESLSIARQNLDNACKLHEVAKAKREMGRISQNDLLQFELNELSARSEYTDGQSTLKNNMFQLRTFLGIDDDDVQLIPEMPSEVPDISVSYDRVLEKALDNNSLSKSIRRRQLEADYEVAIAKGNLREVTLYAQAGFTGTDDNFSGAYNPLKDNQVVEIGIKLPLVDWGKRRGKVKVAESNREVIQSRLRQERLNFCQNIFILVERFNNQRLQLDLAMASDTIAERRYNTNVETFMIGKISTLDLNDSQVTKDETRKEFINQLFLYWYYYYQIRSLTLYDFINESDIDADFEKIVKM